MTITVYRSDDTSAPTLTGQIGSLTTLLDAILVNGYGSKGAAGWAIAFTGTNTRAYRAAAGNRYYLQVDDNNTLAAGANYARTVAYESMTSVTAGTAAVPTSGQVSGGLSIQKSVTADATTRAWFAIASGTFFYFVACANITAATGPVGGTLSYNDAWLCFGDFTSKKSSDAFNTLHIASSTSTISASIMAMIASTTYVAQAGHYVMRPYTQIGSPAQFEKAVAKRSCSSSPTTFGTDTGDPNFPDPITGGMNLSESLIIESGGAPVGLTRGLLPGLYNIQHNATSIAAAYSNLDTIAGAGAFAGITFTLLRLPNGPSNTFGYAAIQTTGTWP